MKEKRNKRISCLCLLFIVLCLPIGAQKERVLNGLVLDSKNEPVIGANVKLREAPSVFTVTDLEGKFFLKVPAGAKTLTITFVGMEAQNVNIGKSGYIKVHLEENNITTDEVVVVGYGQQKKASIVGAIAQTNGKVLERAGGVSSIGAALTGNLPGVITVSTTGSPGEEDPKIYIRGQSSWNNSDPLILVDGVERPMKSVDISSVESISVLKDASATAVFGVKGANGVILITTKRGKEGKADIRIGFNATVKMPSKLENKYDSYDALKIRNESILRELGIDESSWDSYTPAAILEKYRNPANEEEAERYPNVDWQDELVKKSCMSYNANVDVSGGTPFVKYFASADYLYEGDILKTIDNDKGYTPNYAYKRLNMRSNLDFNLTKTTILSANLSGSLGVKNDTYNNDDWEYRIWQSIYSNAPDVYYPKYSDGNWGYYPQSEVTEINSLMTLSNNGSRQTTTTRINTDFTLKQDLGMILKGLSAKALIAFDNAFTARGGKYDSGSAQQEYIDPDTGVSTYANTYGTNQFDYVGSHWYASGDTLVNDSTYRKLYYQVQLDWARKFGKHNITGMGAFSRDRYATGSEFEHYREDWVARVTYDFDSKYFAEVNGAYNGSEKFGPKYRFGFFPSGAVGWMLSEEKIMKKLKFLDMLKLRLSWGQIGDDNVQGSNRWLYESSWTNSGSSKMGNTSGVYSPYTWWIQSSLGNEDLHWEKVTKKNVGVDYSFLGGLLAGSVDVFNDYRTDILLYGSSRSVPTYFGATPAVANLGKVRLKGYELELRANKTFKNGLHLWGNFSMTHSKDKIIDADDPELEAWYQQSEGKQIDQTYSQISSGYYNTWDEVYGSTQLSTDDDDKLPGNQNIVDYNGDGVIDSKDSAPYAYTERPQNTYNATIGFDYKGFSFFVQFYGVNNCSRTLSLTSFSGHLDNVYEQGTMWTSSNTNADVAWPRWNSKMDYTGSTYVYDGSYVRLKNAEISYTFTQPWVKKLGIGSLRLYLNGDNLFLWSKLPDDREVNSGNSTAYPTVKRINLGVNINL
jgi:TonB-linked SusC/RagA family outer membrane protein